jgi:hypothetical protein
MDFSLILVQLSHLFAISHVTAEGRVETPAQEMATL